MTNESMISKTIQMYDYIKETGTVSASGRQLCI